MKRMMSVFLTLMSVFAYAAEPTQDLKKLFPRQAEVLVDPGDSKLAIVPLTTDVLSACKPDLSDLRLVDARGNEVAFLVERGSLSTAGATLKRTVEAKILNADRSQTPRERGPGLFKEVFELSVPPAAEVGNWQLVLHTSRPQFVRRIDVEALDGSKSRMVVERGGVFRLPRSDGERTFVELPPGLGERIRVTLTGEDDAYLAPRFAFENSRSFAGKGRVPVALSELSRDRRSGKTIVELARPSGMTFDSLRLETATPAFDREVEVFDLGPAARETSVGRAKLFRVETVATVEGREVKMAPPTGDRLRVEIVDGDSPQLEQLTFTALAHTTALIAALEPSVGGASAGTIFFGGGRAHPPRYDLAGLLPTLGQVAFEQRAEAASKLLSTDQMRAGRLGAISPNPAFDASPALAFVMHPGAEIDERVYSHQRLLMVQGSADGLSRLHLEPADLAEAREDLADVRIVDAQARQWPYLLERTAAPQWASVVLGVPKREGRSSIYPLVFPAQPVKFDGLSLSFAEPYFDRAYRVLATTPEGVEVVLAQGRLVQGGAQARRDVLEISTQQRRVREARLVIEDGENALLTLQTVKANVLGPELYLAAPPGTYRVLLGNPDDVTPSYDISKVRDLVLAVASAETVPGPLHNNPQFRQRARLAAGQGPQHLMLWGVLGLAVVALGIFTLRLAGRETQEPADKV